MSTIFTRIHKKTMIYIQNNSTLEKINIVELLKNKTVVDKEVFIGFKYKKQLKCRLVAIRLPEKVVKERRRKTTLELLQEYLIPKINFHNVV